MTWLWRPFQSPSQFSSVPTLLQLQWPSCCSLCYPQPRSCLRVFVPADLSGMLFHWLSMCDLLPEFLQISNGALSKSLILTTLSKISALVTTRSALLYLILSSCHVSPHRAVGKLVVPSTSQGLGCWFFKRCFKVILFSHCHHCPPVSAPPKALYTTVVTTCH